MIDNFIKERKYLKGVSDKTLIWYSCSFKAFEGALDSKEAIQERIIDLRGRNVAPVSINTYLRCINAYLRWKGAGFKMGKLKEEQKILSTFNAAQVSRLLSFKPVGFAQHRLYCVLCLLLDCGLRISEALGLSKDDIDLDNLVVLVKGKGGKHRLVPISMELRKVLFRWELKRSVVNGYANFAFCTKQGTKLGVRNILRDFKKLCRKLGVAGVRCSPHTLRHTFAVNYLRNGGDIYFLSRILGHASIKTTEIYLKSLGIDDLKRVHNSFSPLSRTTIP